MKTLLSLPPNVVGCFHEITGLPRQDFFATSDPKESKLGSGGGTIWLLAEAMRAEGERHLDAWLSREKRILLHAGGQSRRLPAYAPSGKSLTPVPVFRWSRGECIDQSLLELQMPLYRQIMDAAPAGYHTLVCSGDVLLRATEALGVIPEDADIVCFGLWGEPEQASHHGVFVMQREHPDVLDFVLQKPSRDVQASLLQTHLTLLDIGVWILSDRAVKCLAEKCGWHSADDVPQMYDLYSQFGTALGENPSQPDEAVSRLTVKVLPLPGGEFYHYGTAAEMIESSLAIQNLVKDQRLILQKGVKLQSSVFTQNSVIAPRPTPENRFVWIENCFIGAGWTLASHNILTGIPQNAWSLDLHDGECIDMVPVDEQSWAARPYGYHDAFRGAVGDAQTTFLGIPVAEWLARHGLGADCLGRTDDLQAARLFPMADDVALLGDVVKWMLDADAEMRSDHAEMRERYLKMPRLAADELSERANLRRLFAQREDLLRQTLPALAQNWRKSVFYQTNLKDLAEKHRLWDIPLPESLPQDAPLMTKIHDAMFRAETLRSQSPADADRHEAEAFSLLRDGLTADVLRQKSSPRRSVLDDQLVWARCPVRIDLAGGWTDTPPYSLLEGGNVVNLAIYLGGQSPLQVYVKPSREFAITCRSIDLGATERIETYEELRQYNKVGSPFSIPKAALTLAGFLPGFGAETYPSLRAQLEAFGSGLEVTLFSAIPAGSGLGTSSILASAVLGALSDFCSLGWDKETIASRTLVLEQMLTTGGGWQDQYGGVLPGLKLLQTRAGFSQLPSVRYLPTDLFCDAAAAPCHLLYYTGVTRTAKHILTEIVRGMFLNSTQHLSLLAEMKAHALEMYEAISRSDFDLYGRLVRRTWMQNQMLDAGTNPPVVDATCRLVDDLCLGYKLPGAGGGGFMYMVAKDAEAAARIRKVLTEHPTAPTARFVDMAVSHEGLQVSRS